MGKEGKIKVFVKVFIAVMIVQLFISGKNVYAATSLNSQVNSMILVPQSTGNAVLDQTVNQILSVIITPNMTNYQKLQACYDYLVAYGRYDAYAGLYYDGYSLGYCTDEQVNAYGMLTTMAGDCYGFSDAFIAMTRVMGFPTYGVRGVTTRSSGGYTNHGWSAMIISGQEYVFDPQIDYNVAKRNGANTHRRIGKRYADIPGKYMQYNAEAMNYIFGPADYHSWILYNVIQAIPCDQSFDNRVVIQF